MVKSTLITPSVLSETVFIAHTIYTNHSHSEQMGLNRLDIDILAICTIKFNSLHLLYSFINVFNVSPAKLIGAYACIDSCFFFLPFSFSLCLCFPFPSMQTQRTRTKQRQEQLPEEISSGFHRSPTQNTFCHLQREQTSIQRNADHHLSTAGLGTYHCQ